MRVLILGGTGAISHYVVEKYKLMGHHVTVMNRGNRKELYINGVEYIIGNANNRESLSAGIGENFYDKILDFVTYDTETMRIKVEVLYKKCRHYVFISSAAVYKRILGVICYSEGMPLGNPEWPYGQKKSECERILCEMYRNKTDSYYTIIRPGITCSEMFIPYSAIDSYNMPGFLIHCVLTRKEILTTNIGEDRMQVMHAADFAENLYALLNHEKSRNQCFNLCGDEYITSNQILEQLSACLRTQAIACYMPQDGFYEKIGVLPLVDVGWHDRHSNEKMKKVLGEEYHNGKKVLDNLHEAVNYFLCHQERMQWSQVAEKQIQEVIDEAKHEGKARIRYISAQTNLKNDWVNLYATLDFRIHESEVLSNKRHINELILAKWLRIEMKRVSLETYFRERGIKRICIYGYGTLGKLVVTALKESHTEIHCVIDRETKAEDGNLKFYKSAAGLEDEYILISVMSDVREITNSLKEQGCRHIMDLEHVLNMLERSEHHGKSKMNEMYPELEKYQSIGKVKGLQVANFGTGLGHYDFCYDELDVNAFNFSLPQQSLEFDYKLMKYYQDTLVPGCKVILVLPYVIFLANRIIEVDEINERYYSVLPRIEVEARCNTTFDAYCEKLERWDKNKRNALKNYVTVKTELQEIHEKDMQIHQAKKLLNIWKRELGIVSYRSGMQRPEWKREIALSKGWLEKILMLCKEKSWKPFVIVPPMSQILLDRISPEFRKANYYDILREVVKKEVPILDYSGNREFCHPDLYGNPCFLAKRGAMLFTRDVLKRIGVL